MNIEWVTIESLAVLVENFVFMYFLHSRFNSKYTGFQPQLFAWCISACWGLLGTFMGFPVYIYDFVWCVIMLLYLLITKSGTTMQKIIGIITVYVINLGTAMAGAGLASLLTYSTVEHASQYEDTSRLLAIIFIKMLQVVLCYILVKGQNIIRDLQRKPLLVLSIATVADFFIVIIAFVCENSLDLNLHQSRLLAWAAVGSLIIIIAILLIYELFIREEVKNVELATKLQRLELESQFNREIDVMYNDMRTWRHEYNNNFLALRAMIEHRELESAIKYIDDNTGVIFKNELTLQTGNYILDAVASSKLWLAHSLNIEVNIQTLYSVKIQIGDNDLCAIVGNLLDNAIEACERMRNNDDKKFINFSIMLQGKNLHISVSNSYNDELKREGERYLTVKKENYHGIGISYVDSIVNKYNGYVVRTQDNGVFETHIMLPLLPPDL